MPLCSSKRIINEESLESWSEKVSHEWKPFFSRQELSLGEEIFRNGEIREIELNEYDAIVHARFDQEECYSLIEWSKRKFTVRGSSKDKILVRALAVAGFHEIEAIVSGAEGDSSAKKAAQRSIKKRENDTVAAGSSKGNARNLVLEFSTETEGLLFRALWIDKRKKSIPALKSEHYIPGDTNALEREKLISLASLARRSSFKFNSKKGYYSLGDIPKIRLFFKTDYDNWKQRFNVILKAGVERLNQGIQNVEIVVDVDTCEQGTLDFYWNMMVGDEVLSAEQARKLIRNTDKPVIIPNIGLVTLPKEKTELLATWKRWLDMYPDGKIPRYLLFSLFGEEPIKLLLSSELISWRDSLFELPDEIGELPSFLRPYQKQGVRWLWHLCDRNCHGLLADEMGLGKTVQILSFIAARAVYDKPNLVVCPASVVPVWVSEVERFFPQLKTAVLKSGNDFYKCNEHILWIASYTQLRMHKFLLQKAGFGYVILDEAQLIKNPDAKVSQACMWIKAEHRIILTGTPLENRYLDLWTLFRFLMPGLLGTRRKFEEQLVHEGVNIREKLRKQIAPFVLRRTKTDVLKELPEKTETECICQLTTIQRREYERLTKDGVKQLGEDIPKAVRERSLSFLTLLTRLRQVCCDPGLLPWIDLGLEESGKIANLIEKLEEILANGHKVVVFSQFVAFLDRINEAIKQNFPETSLYQLTGKTIDRAKPVKGFQDNPDASVILVSLRAGGTGITLHAADYVFLMDPWWNPAVEEQAIDRVHRLGQEKPVFVYRMVTAGTIESRIRKLKSDKKGIFTDVLGGMSDISDIRNYFNSLSELIALLPEEK